MASRRQQSRPGFIWQAVLITLPTLVMAGIALTAIRQDRAAVEREAHRQAEEAAQEFSMKIPSSWGSFLEEEERYAAKWEETLRYQVGGWPGGNAPHKIAPGDNSAAPLDLSEHLAAWKRQFPGLAPGDFLPGGFPLDTNDALTNTASLPFLPQPAAWLRALTTSQRDAWDGLKMLASRGAAQASALEEAFDSFSLLEPMPEARLNGEFLLLSSVPKSATLDSLVGFSGKAGRAASESGLGLESLTLALALKGCPTGGMTATLWNALETHIIEHPDFLDGLLLAEAQGLVASNPAAATALDAWKSLREIRIQRRDLARFLAQIPHAKLPGPTNFWIEFRGQSQFCFVEPTPGSMSPKTPSTNDANQPPGGAVRVVPEPMLESALFSALRSANIELPSFLSWHILLEGHPLKAGSRGSSNGAGFARVLAEREGTLSGQKMVSRQELSGSGALVMPPDPRFSVQVLLTDRSGLYAAHRRRVLLFSGIIAAALFAAAAGLAGAWSAFREQQRLNEMKSNFVSSVSHELRGPIASVRLMAENLELGKVPEAERQREYFRFIGQECRRLSGLIENVLDFSRIDQGRKQYDFESSDLISLTRETVQLMQTYAEQRGVAIRFELPPSANGSLEIIMDAQAIQQALVNLLDNALKHSPHGEKILVEIETAAPGQSVRLRVQDRGPGIAASEHEKIFARFYRVGSELRRDTTGVGIGLSIVKHIVDAHGGKVFVESAPGKGSCFTIELPTTQNPSVHRRKK